MDHSIYTILILYYIFYLFYVAIFKKENKIEITWFFLQIPNSSPMMPVSAQGTSVDVKSTAVVKYSSVKFPVQFSKIRQNTDLNHPPSDRHHSGYYMFSDRTRHANREKFSEFLRYFTHFYKAFIFVYLNIKIYVIWVFITNVNRIRVYLLCRVKKRAK